jgi:adenine-specific DNA-methyltransferase
VIKYIGSKRRLVPVLGAIAEAVGARTALDLFSGTTRVAQELKRRGATVTAIDSARYAEIFARCYIATDARRIDPVELCAAVEHLDGLPGRPGYVTETFCRRSRFFQPFNGERIDAVRDAIDRDFGAGPLFPILLTSLIEAADRVDSTTGVQMAYVKRWSARSYKRLTLRVPHLLEGAGRARRADACAAVADPGLGAFDLAYLDPPYNQHRYTANYHVWETLVAWDAPVPYGVACKRSELRSAAGRSVFNRKRLMPGALREVIERAPARLLVLSYNDESWVTLDELRAMAETRGHVRVLTFDSPRYVGARIGVYNPRGERVGQPARLRNVEYLVLAGDRDDVERAARAGATVQAAMREASAQTAATSPTPAMTNARPTGARASSPSRTRAGGRIRAARLPTSNAPPSASTNQARRSSPRNTIGRGG